MEYLLKIQEATQYIQSKIRVNPEIGLVLGSGLGSLADKIEHPLALPYEEIPHFPVSTVEGHAGRLVVGELEGKIVLAMQGRFHYYEGYSMQEITFPIRIMKALGIQTLIVTNACGGINPDYQPGDLMFITDHINFTGDNPLIGENHESLGPRFPDMSVAYDPDLRKTGLAVAEQLNIRAHKGIYTAVTGPYYFSRAELNMVKKFGSDTIGMSTVPEVIVAVHSGIRVLGISCITDRAVPDELEPLDHATVVEVAGKVRPRFIKLVCAILKEI